MKAKDFGQFIDAFAELLGEAGSAGSARAWRELLPIFTINPSIELKDICKIIDKIDPATITPGADIQNLVSLIGLLKRCLGDNVKATFTKDLTLLATALGRFGQAQIPQFTEVLVQRIAEPTAAPAAQPNGPLTDLIQRYLTDLKSAVGDDGRFTELFKKLKSDPNMKAPQVRQLAKEFTGAVEKTKGGALSRILARHESLMGLEARAKATGGRTAA
jgi:hypothetical protein